MPFKNLEEISDFEKRRSKRGHQRGLELEDMVEKILNELVEEKIILNFERHRRRSREDYDGKDFTMVVADAEEKEIKISFGVTTSQRRWKEAKWLHRNIPQFCFSQINPHNIKIKIKEFLK